MTAKKEISALFEAAKRKKSPEDVYTKLLVYPHRRKQLCTYLFFGFCLFLYIISKNQLTDKNWLLLITPVLVVGGIICLIPKSEEWEYRAWQTQPRQIERHQVERK